jgi:hypothetical protein
MVYRPNERGGIETVDQLLAYVREELRSIAKESSETTTLELRLIYAAPTRPREGMLVAADGTSWNPGGGKGIYAYLGGAWVKL